MSEDIQSITEQLSNVDLSTVQTSYPIPKAGVVNAQITAAEEKRDAKEGAKPYVELKYVLTQDWMTQPMPDSPSKPINAGFPITERVYVAPYTNPNTGETTNMGITQLAKLRESIFGKAPAGTRLNLQELVGNPVVLNLKFDPAPKNKKTGEVYGPQTTVSGYVKQNKAS